jgi:phosphate transport system permease protein
MNKYKKSIQKRYAAETRFRWYGRLAVGTGIMTITFLLYTIFSAGHTAFDRTRVAVDLIIKLEMMRLEMPVTSKKLKKADTLYLLRSNLVKSYPEVKNRKMRRELFLMFSSVAPDEIRDWILSHPESIGSTQRIWVTASSKFDQIFKGNAPREIDEKRRLLSNYQLKLLDSWNTEGRIRKDFNWEFFSHGDSSSPEIAGIGGAIVGSVWTLLVCLILSFPIGVAASVYLEEFAPKNRWTEFVEININNLAAVPSIIFGLLGLAVILNYFGMPRGTPLSGGIVLSLMTMPTIIIASRSALKAVPPSVREAALAMGASPVQVVLHHVLPLAMPGTLTGTIIGLAQALGETAPLLMIGMFAFVVDIPQSPLEPSAALPVQIYLWAESAERGFVEKTAAAIMAILIFLIFMNALAVLLRKHYERRW